MATPPVLRVVEREMRVFARLWRGVVFSLFLSPVLYLAAMGSGSADWSRSTPGTSRASAISISSRPACWSRARCRSRRTSRCGRCSAAVKWVKNFHATVATSITADQVLYGYVLWIGLRAMLGAIAFVLVALLLGAIPSAWGILAIPIAGSARPRFAPLAAFSVGLDSDVAFPVIMRVGVLPLFLFSGTFFPISQLPGWLRKIAMISPLVARRRAGPAPPPDRHLRSDRGTSACSSCASARVVVGPGRFERCVVSAERGRRAIGGSIPACSACCRR